MHNLFLYCQSEQGHRGSYLSLMEISLGAKRTQNIFQLITTSKPIFFITLEGVLTLFTALAFLRALMGRRTAGLLLRPGPALKGKSYRLRLKKFILKLFRIFPQIKVLTILPFYIEPQFSKIADGWIYDPQLWDLTLSDRKRAEYSTDKIRSDVFKVSRGRPICIALGRQDKDKGFDRFLKIYANDPALAHSILFAS